MIYDGEYYVSRNKRLKIMREEINSGSSYLSNQQGYCQQWGIGSQFVPVVDDWLFFFFFFFYSTKILYERVLISFTLFLLMTAIVMLGMS